MERLAVSIEEAAESLGIGRTKMWELVQAGSIRSFRVGVQRRISVKDLEAWVEAQQSEIAPDSELPTVLQMPVSLARRTYTRRRRTEQ
jgi:excisionase family DNA binding protein